MWYDVAAPLRRGDAAHRGQVSIAMIPRQVVRLRANRPVTIWVVGDLQLGHINCDLPKFERHLARAVAEGWRAICIGDMSENVSMSAKVARYGALHEQVDQPGIPSLNHQMEAVLDYMKGIKHWDGYVTGNHESRTLIAGFDPAMEMARQLKARYLEDGGYVLYQFPNGLKRTFFCHHGEGPVVSPTTLFTRLEMTFPGAHVYCAGHTHHLLCEPTIKVTPDGEHTVWRIRTGNYLRLPRYAVRRPIIAPDETGSAAVTLYPNGEIEPRLLT